MRGKKTKGRQRINIRKVEKDEDRLVTLSKRRNGIYTKISELSILCDAEVGFLVYSGAGKPHTFGNPSFETVAMRFLNIEGSSSSSSLVVNAERKEMLEALCDEYNSVVEKYDEEEAMIMKREAALEAALPAESDAWWKVDPEEVKEDEDAKQLLKKYEDLYEKLCKVAEGKKNGGDAGSSSSAANNPDG